MPELKTLTQKMELAGVTDVQVTDAVSDGEGGFVRSLKIFTDNPSLPTMELLIKSDTKADLDITTPELSF